MVFSLPVVLLGSSRTLAGVPIAKRSCSFGSSVSACFWEATKTGCCAVIASSSAFTLLVRDTSNGTTMRGKTTNSRTGRSGNLLGNLFFFLVLQDRWVHFVYDFIVHSTAQQI